MQGGKHFDRPVRLEIRDGREVVVTTYVRGGGSAVYDDMLALWQSPFGRDRRSPGLPQPLSVDLATGEVVMTRVHGTTLGDSPSRLPEVAALLADLHASGVIVRRVRSADGLLVSSRRKADKLSARSVGPAAVVGAAPVAEAANKVMDLLELRCPRQEVLVSCHGDFSPRNVLGDATSLVLIDLDQMRMADPAHDLAYWGAWIWARAVMQDKVPGWAGLSLLLENYAGRLGGRSLVASRSLVFHQAVALLGIAYSSSKLHRRPGAQLVLLGEAARLLGGGS